MNRLKSTIVGIVWAVCFGLVVGVALAAQAQGAPADAGEPTLPTGVALAFFIVGAVCASLIPLLERLAPRTENKVDDAALEGLKRLKPMLDAWADPTNPAVPPSPTNPDGVQR